MINDGIQKILKQAFNSEFGISLDRVDLENPDPVFGDVAFSCHFLAKDLKMSPQEIASRVADKIKDKSIDSVSAVSGYVNFKISHEFLAQKVITEILAKKDKFGKSDILKKEKILLEYSSPNTNKPLHLGHARNNFLGMSLCGILEFCGAKVIKTQVINDRGIHIMKSLVAYEKFGKGATPKSAGAKGDHFVGDFYVKFDEETMMDDARSALLGWENGDKKILNLWKKMNSWVYQGYAKTYKELGSEFDKNYYESEIYLYGKDIVEKGLKSGLFYSKADGSVWVNLEDIGLDEKLLIRSDGTSVYITQDLALAFLRAKTFKFDSMIYLVGHEQEYHFKALFEIFKRLGFAWAQKSSHLSYGLVFLPEGKMKSREGKVVDADDIVEDMKNLALQEIEKRFPNLSKKEKSKRSRAIGIGALKFMILKITPSQSIHFDPKEAVSFEGATGPYVQYAHARICSIMSRAKVKKVEKIDFSEMDSKEERDVLNCLCRYEKVLTLSCEKMNPSLICNYLLDLSACFNTFYHKHKVLKAETKSKIDSRLALCLCVKYVLKSALEILKIEAPEKM